MGIPGFQQECPLFIGLLALSIYLKRGTLSSTAAGRSAVTAANLDLIQAAVIFGIVIGTAAHAALDVAVYIVLIHCLKSSFIVDGLSMALPEAFMYKQSIFFFIFHLIQLG